MVLLVLVVVCVCVYMCVYVCERSCTYVCVRTCVCGCLCYQIDCLQHLCTLTEARGKFVVLLAIAEAMIANKL